MTPDEKRAVERVEVCLAIAMLLPHVTHEKGCTATKSGKPEACDCGLASAAATLGRFLEGTSNEDVKTAARVSVGLRKAEG